MDFKRFLTHAAHAATHVAHHAGAKNVPLLHKPNQHLQKKLKKKLSEEEGEPMSESFEAWLLEWKRFVYSKDGVRKQVKTDREAEEWKNTIAKPKKEPKAREPKVDEYNWSQIGRIIEIEVGNHFPDTEGWDAIAKQVRKLYPHLTMDTVGDVIDKAAKKALDSKDFYSYLQKFYKAHGHEI